MRSRAHQTPEAMRSRQARRRSRGRRSPRDAWRSGSVTRSGRCSKTPSWQNCLRRRPAVSPARLALVSVLQFAEGLSDRQAADAVRARIDWKYALGLELTDTGFDASVLSEFRARLVDGDAAQRLLEGMLERLRERGLLIAGGRQRTDATCVVAAVRELNRLELVTETMRAALEALAAAAPTWLLAIAPADWYQRYGQRASDYRLPQAKAARAALAVTVGADGFVLLEAVHAAEAPGWLREIPAVQTLSVNRPSETLVGSAA